MRRSWLILFAGWTVLAFAGPSCAGEREAPPPPGEAAVPLPPNAGCLACHFGRNESPHPRETIAEPEVGDRLGRCTTCHGGDESQGRSFYRERAELERRLANVPREDRPAVSGLRNVLIRRPLLRTAAHRDLVADPGAFGQGERGCGQSGCHADIAASARRSTMTHAAGIIYDLRRAAGLPPAADRGRRVGSRRALGAVARTLEPAAGAGNSPLDGLDPLPRPPPHPDATALEADGALRPEGPGAHWLDRLLRQECLRCHQGIDWAQVRAANGDRAETLRPRGDYTGSGCSACHVAYADHGQTREDDYCVPAAFRLAAGRGQAEGRRVGYPLRHAISRRVETEQCLHCHNCPFGVGPEFVGLAPLERGTTRRHGREWASDLAPPDIHHEKGLNCADCHARREMHGDGALYRFARDQVGVSCRDCHQAPAAPAPLTHERLSREGQAVILAASGGAGDRWAVPQMSLTSAAHAPYHRNNLACAACHAAWLPRYYGLEAFVHLGLDPDRSPQLDLALHYSGVDFVPEPAGVAGERFTPELGQVAVDWHAIRLGPPPLGVVGASLLEADSRPVIRPFGPGPQPIGSFRGFRPPLGGEAAAVNAPRAGDFSHLVFRDGEGKIPFLFNPRAPHTIRPRGRDCDSCHENEAAAGAGGTLAYNGETLTWPGGEGESRPALPDDYRLDRAVTRSGLPLQRSTHPRARPLTGAEMDRLFYARRPPPPPPPGTAAAVGVVLFLLFTLAVSGKRGCQTAVRR